ncbi:MAG: GNAT family N-acetyltransferase [Treponema sp.]|nr:GNAT family N-acetyltransferase [Treponema sp.]
MIIRNAQNKTKDCKLVFSLSNDSLVRSNSFNTKRIEYKEHCKWFEKTLEDKNTLFFLVFADESEKEFIGQIRFKRECENSNECVISLSITEQFRGRHIAKEFLELGISELQMNWKNIDTIIAEVKDENIASNKLFEKEGFKLVSRVNTYKLITCSSGGDEFTKLKINCNFSNKRVA